MESSVRAFRRNLEPFEKDRPAPPWHISGHTDLVSERRCLVSWAPLDARARTPLASNVVSDQQAGLTTIVVGKAAPKRRVEALEKRVEVLRAPEREGKIDLAWLLRRLGATQITSLLVEGGGEVNGSFLLGGLAHRVAFFFAPKILGGRNSRPGVAGAGAVSLAQVLELQEMEWRRLGEDLLLTGRVVEGKGGMLKR